MARRIDKDCLTTTAVIIHAEFMWYAASHNPTRRRIAFNKISIGAFIVRTDWHAAIFIGAVHVSDAIIRAILVVFVQTIQSTLTSTERATDATTTELLFLAVLTRIA